MSTDPRLGPAPAAQQARLLALAEALDWPEVTLWDESVLWPDEGMWRAWLPTLNAMAVAYVCGVLERRLVECPEGVALSDWLAGTEESEDSVGVAQ